MSNIDEQIRKFSLLRIAKIFNVSVDSLSQENKFGYDLKASSSPGLFRRNEYEQIENDIYDVANKQVYKEITSGNLTIQTVGEYCDHMVRCYGIKPADVRHVLEME